MNKTYIILFFKINLVVLPAGKILWFASLDASLLRFICFLIKVVVFTFGKN